jgi:GTPase SAR1 family protein
MRSSSNSDVNVTSNFQVLLAGRSENKLQIVKLLEEHRKSCGTSMAGIDFDIVKASEIAFQIWNLAAQERFRTIQSSYYKNAKAIIIFAENVDDFISIYNSIFGTLSMDSKCGVGVISTNGHVLSTASELSLFHINPAISDLKSFLQTVFTCSQQKRVLNWQAERIGEYYNEIAKALNFSGESDKNIAELIVQYALPYSVSFYRSHIQETNLENRFQALIHEAATLADPMLEIRIYQYYKEARELTLANAHLQLAKDLISDIENQLVTQRYIDSICSLLRKDTNEESNINTLLKIFEERTQRIPTLQAVVSLPPQLVLFSQNAPVVSVSQPIDEPHPGLRQ